MFQEAGANISVLMAQSWLSLTDSVSWVYRETH
jgi:hypothetical protein